MHNHKIYKHTHHRHTRTSIRTNVELTGCKIKIEHHFDFLQNL